MVYQDKYFDQDKNAILRAAQGFVEPQLTKRWIEIALFHYHQIENPMGLMDDFMVNLMSIRKYDTSFLKEPYELVSAIYRLKHGDNQLEFIWDGRSHYEVYAENWMTCFDAICNVLCAKKEVYRSILKACVLQQETNHKFLFYGFRKQILEHFNVSINRKRMLTSA